MIGLLCHGLIFHYLIYVAGVRGPKKNLPHLNCWYFFYRGLGWDFVVSALRVGDRAPAGEPEIWWVFFVLLGYQGCFDLPWWNVRCWIAPETEGDLFFVFSSSGGFGGEFWATKVDKAFPYTQANVMTPKSQWGTVPFEAETQTWRTGFSLFQCGQFVLLGAVCSPRSEIKRQAVCKR